MFLSCDALTAGDFGDFDFLGLFCEYEFFALICTPAKTENVKSQ